MFENYYLVLCYRPVVLVCAEIFLLKIPLTDPRNLEGTPLMLDASDETLSHVHTPTHS